MEKKSVSLQERMDEIKLVNRAKWTLITNLNMSEEAAHRYIEKQAMDKNYSRDSIETSVVDGNTLTITVKEYKPIEP